MQGFCFCDMVLVYRYSGSRLAFEVKISWTAQVWVMKHETRNSPWKREDRDEKLG